MSDAGTCGPHAASRVERNGGAHTFTCDANGNITGGNTLSASYDFNNQPWQVSRAGAGTAQFAYTADGQVFRRISGATTWFGPGGYEETHAGGIVTQRHELGPVVVLRENGVDAFKAILRDRLGSQVLRVSGVPGAGTGTTPTLSATPNPSLDGHYAVSWTPITGASRYELRESRNGAADDTLVYNGANLTWSPPGAKSVARYTYRVRACTPVCGEDSAPVTEEVVPAPPSSISVSENPSPDGSFTVSWSSSSGALAYQVEEKDEHPKFHVLASGVTALTLPVTGKAPGTYQYRVRACLTACGNPSAVVSVEVTGGGGGAPAIPVLNPVDPNPSSGHISLSWSTSPTAQFYVVSERRNGGNWGAHAWNSATSEELDRDNGEYDFRVRACLIADQVVCSFDSAIVPVSVQGSGVPATPATLTSSVPAGQCLPYSRPSTGEPLSATYQISWSSSSLAQVYVLTETNADLDTSESFELSGLSKWFTHYKSEIGSGTPSTAYGYEVKACTGTGNERVCSPPRAGAYTCLGNPNQINSPEGEGPASTAYDAFGKVRNGDYSDKPGGTLDALPDTLRGFTGHQHVDEVRLIHMNGRIYDYELGRFLSVDPVIQFPANSQSLNPYSYIMNNPLAGRDPSGYFIKPPWAIVQPESMCMGGDAVCRADQDAKFLAGEVGAWRATLSIGGGPDSNGWDMNQGTKPRQVEATVKIGEISTLQETGLNGTQVAYTCTDPVQCQKFEAGLLKVREVAENSKDLNEEERERLTKAANAYGEKGEAGVAIGFKDINGAGAVARRNKDGTMEVDFPVPRTATQVLPRSISHEGQHIVDDLVRGGELTSREERMTTEINSYMTQAIYQKGNFETTSLQLWLPGIGYQQDKIRAAAEKSVDLACNAAGNDQSCK